MSDKRQKIKGRRSGPTFAIKPHHIVRADTKNNHPSPASVLSHKASHLLDNLIAQFNGRNNGDISAAPKIMALYGWTSQGSVYSGLVELLALGFIEQTRQGGKNQYSLYAVTWLAIDDCDGKLDVNRCRQRFLFRFESLDERKAYVFELAKLVKAFNFLSSFYSYDEAIEQFVMFAEFI